jgi:hypothetical protein
MLTELDIWTTKYELQRELDKLIERNGNGCEGEWCTVRKANIYSCFTGYNQGLETWYFKKSLILCSNKQYT